MIKHKKATDMIKAFNPDECLFVGTINELQQTLQETTRARIQAENRLLKISKDDESYDERLCK